MVLVCVLLTIRLPTSRTEHWDTFAFDPQGASQTVHKRDQGGSGMTWWIDISLVSNHRLQSINLCQHQAKHNPAQHPQSKPTSIIEAPSRTSSLRSNIRSQRDIPNRLVTTHETSHIDPTAVPTTRRKGFLDVRPWICQVEVPCIGSSVICNG